LAHVLFAGVIDRCKTVSEMFPNNIFIRDTGEQGMQVMIGGEVKFEPPRGSRPSIAMLANDATLRFGRQPHEALAIFSSRLGDGGEDVVPPHWSHDCTFSRVPDGVQVTIPVGPLGTQIVRVIRWGEEVWGALTQVAGGTTHTIKEGQIRFRSWTSDQIVFDVKEYKMNEKLDTQAPAWRRKISNLGGNDLLLTGKMFTLLSPVTHFLTLANKKINLHTENQKIERSSLYNSMYSSVPRVKIYGFPEVISAAMSVPVAQEQVRDLAWKVQGQNSDIYSSLVLTPHSLRLHAMQMYSNLAVHNTPKAKYFGSMERVVHQVDGTSAVRELPGPSHVVQNGIIAHAQMNGRVTSEFRKIKVIKAPRLPQQPPSEEPAAAPAPAVEAPAAPAAVETRVVGESHPINDIIWDKYQQSDAWACMSSADKAAIMKLGKFHPAPIVWFTVSYYECHCYGTWAWGLGSFDIVTHPYFSRVCPCRTLFSPPLEGLPPPATTCGKGSSTTESCRILSRRSGT
jgi:hypothetical protein